MVDTLPTIGVARPEETRPEIPAGFLLASAFHPQNQDLIMALPAATLARLQARLDLYYAAEAKILANQSYELPDGRRLERANLKEVQDMIKSLEGRVDGGSAVPVVRGRARRFVNLSR